MYVPISNIDDNVYSLQIESDLTFLGLVGIVDPARPMVKESIANCRKAGIRVIMITGTNKLRQPLNHLFFFLLYASLFQGDNQVTAESIARKIGMFQPDEDLRGKSFTGKQFMQLDEAAQVGALMSDSGCRVFSRTEPTEKQTLVKLLRKQNEVVAMTGDGVNDAPGL